MNHIFILFIAILLQGCVIFPLPEVYTPEFKGVILDELGKPVSNAKVTRIEPSSRAGEYGSMVSVRVNTDEVFTNKNGEFYLPNKSKTVWFHGGIQSNLFSCFGSFQVEANGYLTYIANENKFTKMTEHGERCEGVAFLVDVRLQKVTNSKN
ncbi:hypothetical protein [Pleionea mediterranea]|uniref:Carboxypeptidase family protein n=1 Tax=Pleionea mediterranea TaxID=523701 RepID=A0A316FX48_9GAMM|nr:hypothetical protein [Pleionea mediterranea]PWK52902.1 hypothetical protein C8D97_104120 [Pleionea mediterranea]